MRPTASQYVQALEELSQENILPATTLAQNFADFLRRRGESKKLGAILKQLGRREALRKGSLAVTVITAHPLSPEMKQSLVKKAENIFPKKKIIFSYKMQKDNIGGVCFQTDEVLYDATVKTRLFALERVIQR